MVSNKISGWYYDLQLENRLTSVSLHPNKVLDNKGNWVDFFSSEAKNTKFNKTDSDFNSEDIKKKEGEEGGINMRYSSYPICRAIVYEDFNVSVANSWSDFGGDMVGQIWESLKPLAPYADYIKKKIHVAAEKYEKLAKSQDPKDKASLEKTQGAKSSRAFAEFMTKTDNALQNGVIDVTDYLNRSLVVQGTRFSYYSGSGTSFGNLLMKFTIFPTFDGKNFVTVTEQVEEILPYCIGKFVKGDYGLVKNKKGEEESLLSKETSELVNNLVGWQLPPGGFKSHYKNVDVVQEGTLMLRFGAFYRITNLVVENASFNFSKQMTKNPKLLSSESGNSNDSILSPLYCDVTIQLRPATKYSSESLKEFVLSRNSEVLKETSGELKENLKSSDKYNVY